MKLMSKIIRLRTWNEFFFKAKIGSPWFIASWKGVSPALSFLLISAPSSMSLATRSTSPRLQAWCSFVLPSKFLPPDVGFLSLLTSSRRFCSDSYKIIRELYQNTFNHATLVWIGNFDWWKFWTKNRLGCCKLGIGHLQKIRHLWIKKSPGP